MVQPSSTRIPPHGRRLQPVKKVDEKPKSYLEFNKEFGGSTSSYHDYLQAFHEKSEAATIKCKLVTTDGITVEADKLKGIEELDVDDQQVAQQLVHSRVLRLRRADRRREYMNEFDSDSETDENPTAGIKTADQRLLSFTDYYLDIATGDEYLPDLRFAIPNLYPADNMRYLTTPLFENDDMLYHSNRFRPWWEEESALSNQPASERLEMHPESLKDRIKWYHHLVSTRAPLSKLSQYSRSKVHWNEMIDLSREHEHHVNRLSAIRHEINNANKSFPSDFKLS
jgi:hypothetical protein